jgi:hypothetical protein
VVFFLQPGGETISSMTISRFRARARGSVAANFLRPGCCRCAGRRHALQTVRNPSRMRPQRNRAAVRTGGSWTAYLPLHVSADTQQRDCGAGSCRPPIRRRRCHRQVDSTAKGVEMTYLGR